MARAINPGKTNTFREESKEENIREDSIPEPEIAAKKEKKKKETVSEKTKPPKEKNIPTQKELAHREQRFRVVGLFFLLFSLYLLFSFTSYLLSWQSDFSFTDTIFKHFTFDRLFENKIPVENWMGKIGALTAYLFISKWFGVASFFFVIILFNTGMKQFFHIQILPVLKT
ncbi:MAG: DNA translocase FtsK 4TM domain-containing protein, partial [Bacteroidota bacterium]